MSFPLIVRVFKDSHPIVMSSTLQYYATTWDAVCLLV